MRNIPDAPDIREREKNGVPDGTVYCPICGDACDTIYKDRWGNILGCDQCITPMNAWEALDE